MMPTLRMRLLTICWVQDWDIKRILIKKSGLKFLPELIIYLIQNTAWEMILTPLADDITMQRQEEIITWELHFGLIKSSAPFAVNK